MATILVTGIAGFIGSTTAHLLADRGDTVIGVDNFNPYYDPKLKRDRAKRLEGKAKIYECDIIDLPGLRKVFSQHKVDKVLHLAAQAGVRYSIENPFAYEQANNLGTLNMLEICRELGVKTFVFASSSSVYGGNTKTPFSVNDPVDHPISLYAATKKYNELIAHVYHHLFGMNCTGLRFFTVYGPWGRPDMALFKFTDATIKGQPIDVYNHGKMKRDFTFVTDIAAGIIASLDKSYPYEIFNLGNSSTVDLTYYIECIEKELGKKAIKNMLPMQPGDVPATMADIEKSKRMLGFDPKVKVEQGIKEFVQWYRDYFKTA